MQQHTITNASDLTHNVLANTQQLINRTFHSGEGLVDHWVRAIKSDLRELAEVAPATAVETIAALRTMLDNPAHIVPEYLTCWTCGPNGEPDLTEVDTWHLEMVQEVVASACD